MEFASKEELSGFLIHFTTPHNLESLFATVVDGRHLMSDIFHPSPIWIDAFDEVPDFLEQSVQNVVFLITFY